MFDCIYQGGFTINWITYIIGDDLDKDFVMIKLTINREGNRNTYYNLRLISN